MQHAFHGPIRRTKIVATLGPATDREGVLDAIIEAGVDVVRLNFSHGNPEDHRRRLTGGRTGRTDHVELVFQHVVKRPGHCLLEQGKWRSLEW